MAHLQERRPWAWPDVLWLVMTLLGLLLLAYVALAVW